MCHSPTIHRDVNTGTLSHSQEALLLITVKREEIFGELSLLPKVSQ